MALNSKVIYLRKENGSSIKAYVVDYLLDTMTNKEYVIIVNANGQNAKGLQLIDNDAYILSLEDAKLVSRYKNDSSFRILTDIYEDGLVFELKKKGEKKVENQQNVTEVIEKEEEIEPVTSDEEEMESHSSFDNTLEKELEERQIEAHVSKEIDEHLGQEELLSKEISQLEEDNDSLEEVSQEDKSVDTNIYQGIIESKEIGKRIIIYIYDQTVIKKYNGKITSIEEDGVVITDLKAIQKLDVSEDFDINHFIGETSFEEGACFVDYEDYIPTVKMENGKSIISAKITHFLRKPLKDEENIKDKIIVFKGEEEYYADKNHYSIWGAVCTVVSGKPFIVKPEKNGVKTIIFEDPEATSLEEACQNYQNLYPSTPVYLLKDRDLAGSEEQELDENSYVAFSVETDIKMESLLEVGRRVLTEEEMIARRASELEALRNREDVKKKR